ncbi:hypothetical protein WT60_05975 [Burkholderia sp. MSMB617WGS]|nr:hypothetical protein WS78_04820 [Burkholderia savannae]AOK46446.1 hypothetical protein WT60_05975 [Burkholderia sp. MSMB617WGS]KVG40535.1 hypothetical protein WS77_18585 [Burkholderia sp. MSMB0265]KVG84693.1 hypothetical protein WS81_05685 [Burkholderia sp. MSMB2040]KVG90262.1 hypothetical protein WS82_19255 [Burkholderia sp. MSMB2041]KVG91267.1 hypothetical protein WS83_14595 [Burkholderia sp. MSMB2042]KVK77882.1 hypothetical protein WS91_15615 [Burkholderia sp. MSMB1498]
MADNANAGGIGRGRGGAHARRGDRDGVAYASAGAIGGTWMRRFRSAPTSRAAALDARRRGLSGRRRLAGWMAVSRFDGVDEAAIACAHRAANRPMLAMMRAVESDEMNIGRSRRRMSACADRRRRVRLR